MRVISIDLESYSDIDLSSCGVYRYAESPAFEILLFGYSIDGAPVEVVDLTSGDAIPDGILRALFDPSIKKWAFNAMFERVCLSTYLHRHYPQYISTDYLDPEGWYCTMVWSGYLGLPMSLKGAGAALGLDEQKMKEGSDLIRYFCMPCRPTKANGERTRNLASDAPEKWDVFKRYNRRDVEVEQSIQERLRNYPVPGFVWDEYHLDQEINDRGILLDMLLVKSAIAIDEKCRSSLLSQLKDLTGLENPNSVMQLKEWLEERGAGMESLGKKEVVAAIRDVPEDVAKVLELRQKIAKSSVKKYTAMQNMACSDDRARGMFRFYKANRTGRYASAGIQLQNLPQNHMEALEDARQLVRAGDMETLDMLYDNLPNVLSELIRTAFIPSPGKKFIVADFSAIEARVLAYLAGEKWRMDAFAQGKDIYCASASQMFGVPVEKHGENGHLRQKGKIAELALGYGGSDGALRAMGALEMGLSEDELKPLVSAWREANPRIVSFWWDVDRAVKMAVKEKTPQEVRGIRFICRSGMLFLTLPSGRSLAYVKPRIGENRFGGECVTYMGIGPTKKWERLESYGPKFVENITQAVSRDVLCHAMKNLRDHAIVAHVHDEVIIEAEPDVSVDEICEVMGRTPPWLPGLNLRADGYECQFYRKD